MAPPAKTSLLWKRTENVGRGEEVRGFGGVVCPLIAGFSLAAIAQLVSADNPPPLACLAVLAFASTAVLLLFAVQFSFLVLRHSATPDERLSWHPEARVHPEALQSERLRQAEDKLLADAYYQRATFLYNLGLTSFFAGLGFTVVPSNWNVAAVAATAIAATAGLVEAWWIVRGGGLRLPRGALVPSRASLSSKVHLSELDQVSVAALTGKSSWVKPTAKGTAANQAAVSQENRSAQGQSQPPDEPRDPGS